MVPNIPAHHAGEGLQSHEGTQPGSEGAGHGVPHRALFYAFFWKRLLLQHIKKGNVTLRPSRLLLGNPSMADFRFRVNPAPWARRVMARVRSLEGKPDPGAGTGAEPPAGAFTAEVPPPLPYPVLSTLPIEPAHFAKCNVASNCSWKALVAPASPAAQTQLS